MDIGIISSRYAKTLLRFATELHQEDAVYGEMQVLARNFRALPALQQAMLNPVLTAQQLQSLLETAATGEGTAPSEATRRFLQLVVENKRADLMTFVASAYLDKYNRSKGRISGRLIVPTAVKPETEAKLRQMAEKHAQAQVDFTTEVDPALGGGFILEYDTYRLDASLRTQVQELRRQLN